MTFNDLKEGDLITWPDISPLLVSKARRIKVPAFGHRPEVEITLLMSRPRAFRYFADTSIDAMWGDVESVLRNGKVVWRETK